MVPCNGCIRCCTARSVRTLDPDEVHRYESVPSMDDPNKRVLASQASGACVYVNANGCSIHDRKPRLCREFDCRELVKRYSYTILRRAGYTEIWRKGKELTKQ